MKSPDSSETIPIMGLSVLPGPGESFTWPARSLYVMKTLYFSKTVAHLGGSYFNIENP